MPSAHLSPVGSRKCGEGEFVKHETSLQERYLKSCRCGFWQEVFQRELEYLCEHLRGCRDILSIGCGPAIIESGLAKRGFRVTGLDVSTEALDRAPDNIRIVVARAEDMSFHDDSFDAVIFVASLQFVDDYRMAVEKSVRVLRPNGRIMVMLLNPESAYFKDRFRDPYSYVSRIKHTDIQAIEDMIRGRFAIHTEYFLHLEGDKIFVNLKEEADAALYVIRGVKKPSFEDM